MSDEPTGSGRGRKEKKGGERKRERNSVKLTGHFFINSVHLPSLSHYIKTCHPEKISVCVCVCVVFISSYGVCVCCVFSSSGVLISVVYRSERQRGDRGAGLL